MCAHVCVCVLCSSDVVEARGRYRVSSSIAYFLRQSFTESGAQKADMSGVFLFVCFVDVDDNKKSQVSQTSLEYDLPHHLCAGVPGVYNHTQFIHPEGEPRASRMLGKRSTH